MTLPLSRAREAVTVYTDDKARLMEAIRCSGARITAHELLRLPVTANGIDPFEAILCEKIPIPQHDFFRPAMKVEKEYVSKKAQATESPRECHQQKFFGYFEPEQQKRGVSP
jgi:hypothetical protein